MLGRRTWWLASVDIDIQLDVQRVTLTLELTNFKVDIADAPYFDCVCSGTDVVALYSGDRCGCWSKWMARRVVG